MFLERSKEVVKEVAVTWKGVGGIQVERYKMEGGKGGMYSSGAAKKILQPTS